MAIEGKITVEHNADRLASQLEKGISKGLMTLGIGKPGSAVAAGAVAGVTAGTTLFFLKSIATAVQDFPLVVAIMKMFKLILMMLLLPLIPILKPILIALGELAKTLSRTGNMEGFDKAAVELMQTVLGGAIAGIIGVGILAAISGTALTTAIAGVIAAALSLNLIFASFTEKDLKGKLLEAGFGILSGVLAGFMLGGVPGALTGLVITVGLTSISFAFSAIKEEDLKTALLEAGIASILAGGLAAFFLGGPAGIAVGLFTLFVILGLKFWGTPKSTGSFLGDIGANVFGLEYGEPEMFQHGGIINQPTMGMLGEAGPEAVIPLSKLKGMGGGTTNIYIDKPTFRDDKDIRELVRQISIEQQKTMRRYVSYTGGT